MKIGVYGGTFNPIHVGHMAAARGAAEALGLDMLLLIPAGLPPHKVLAADTPGAKHRLEMARLALECMELPCERRVLDLELKREGNSYTLDTLRELREKFPKDRLYFLMGTDMFLTFQDWREPGKIARLCTLCAFGREAGDRERLREQKIRLERELGADAVVLELPGMVEVSSTQLRESLERGEGREFLAPVVYGYILRNGLYGTKADMRHLSLEDLRCVAQTMLKHTRVPHVLGTEGTAAALARRWGADEESARRAALLHDCTKKCNWEQHMDLCRLYHIPLDKEERREEKLLHAITGAAVAREEFGVSPEIESAIRWHTTGKADMTLLEKIIYLADYIEPTRDFCDLRELRALAFEDIDRAMLLGLTMAVRDLKKRGVAVHSNSVRARDYLKGKLDT